MRQSTERCEQAETRLAGEAPFRRHRKARVPLSSVREGASPATGFNPSVLFVCRLLASCSLRALLRACSRPITRIDREAVYRNALPLVPVRCHISRWRSRSVETRTSAAAACCAFRTLSTHGQRVPALLFTPLQALRSASRAVPGAPARPGRQQRNHGRAGPVRRAVGYASLAIDEYGQGERAPVQAKPGSQAEQLATTVRQTVVDVRRGWIIWGRGPTSTRRRSGWPGFRSARLSAR